MSMWSNWSLHAMLVETYNSATLWRFGSIAVSPRKPLWGPAALRCMRKTTENRRARKNTCINVNSSINCNSQKAETVQMSINRRMDKQMVLPDPGVLSNHKQEWSPDKKNNRWTLKMSCKVQYARHKGHLLYNAIYMKYPEEANP